MRKSGSALHRFLLGMGAISIIVGISGCGKDEKDDKKAATQAAARVNKDEITIHEINRLLQSQRGLTAEQLDKASRQALERLIDQELAAQKAGEQKIDRDAKVVAAIEAAKREIIARAYFDKIADGAPKPSAEDVKKYYDENPALFAQRRIYQLQEVVIEASSAEVEALRPKLTAAKNANQFAETLRAANIKFRVSQAVRASEQVPMTLLPVLAKMKDGDSMFNSTPTGALVAFLAGSRSQPVDEARARPAIEQFLLNERKRKLIADDIKSLRSNAQIKYLGTFADGAPKTEVIPTAPTAAEVAASAAKALDEASIKSGFGLKDAASGAGAREAAAIAEPAAPAASSMDTSTINKGLGLGK